MTRWTDVKRTTNSESIIKFTRTVDVGFIHQTSAASLFGATMFKLDQVPDYAEFAMYDQYKIAQIEVKFVPSFNSNTNDTTTQFTMPHLMTAIDMDDVGTPTELNILDNQSNVQHECGKVASRVFSPRVAQALYAGVASFGYGERKQAWVDVTSPAVEHYGLKYMMKADSNDQPDAFGYRVFIKYWLEFKKVC